MPDRAHKPGRRILVIDDNPAIHADFRKVLCGGQHPLALLDAAEALFGERPAMVPEVAYEIDGAFQGGQGLDMLRQSLDQRRSYDVAFVDMRMPPGWDGLETIERLWQVDDELHVVICTAFSDHSSGEILKRLGRSDRLLILKKPFDSIEVQQLASALSEKRQLMRERALYTSRLEDQVRIQTGTIRLAHEETIHRLVAASMFRDKETGEHIRRVGLMSAILARAAGRSATEVDHIRLAAPMHDVGKIGIPDAILQKPSLLTPEERKVMQGHTVIGANLLSGSSSPMLQMARDIALSHHEQWNGMGYPAGLSRWDIPFEARIVAIVDVFDALTHDRVYRPAFSVSVALNILQEGNGTQFDPEIVDLFFNNLDEIKAVIHEHRDTPLASTIHFGREETRTCLEQMTEFAVC